MLLLLLGSYAWCKWFSFLFKRDTGSSFVAADLLSFPTTTAFLVALSTIKLLSLLLPEEVALLLPCQFLTSHRLRRRCMLSFKLLHVLHGWLWCTGTSFCVPLGRCRSVRSFGSFGSSLSSPLAASAAYSCLCNSAASAAKCFFILVQFSCQATLQS